MHITPMIRDVGCENLDEIRREHRIYWLGKKDTLSGLAGESGDVAVGED